MPCAQTSDLAVRNGFLVFPTCTDLQRVGTGRDFANAKAVVLIDGMRVVHGDDETIDANALRLSVLWESLQPFCRGESGNVIFIVWCRIFSARSEDDRAWPASSILMLALQQFGQEVGFCEVAVDVYFLPADNPYINDWKQAVTDFASDPSELEADERAVGDEQVRLYPVRTRLSRLLYDGADCVAQIVPPIEKLDATSAMETMKRSLSELRLETKDRVVFLHHWKNVEAANTEAVASECMRLWRHEVFGFKESVALCWQDRRRHDLITHR